jgi:hypothetical protein
MKGCTTLGSCFHRSTAWLQPEDWDNIQKQQNRLSLLPSRANTTLDSIR